MRYIGFDMGDGESAVAAFEHGSGIEPVIWPVCGARSLLSAVGTLNGDIVIGENAYTDALAQDLSVRFKSRFTSDPASYDDVVRFVRGVLRDLAGRLSSQDRFVVGCPAGWNSAARARYRDLLIRAGISQPQVISESRAAFLYARHAHTIAMDVDVMNDSALVVDIGSSTLDFAYIVDGRETGVGTFGDAYLGGGILDAALLRRSVEKSRDRRAIEAVFRQSRSWYSYCEIEARRVKEDYFTQLVSGEIASARKQLRICYDGVQWLTIALDQQEAEQLISSPLPELEGRSFLQAMREALGNAARITADRPPKLVLLTGGASRMPFIAQLCRQVFEGAAVVCCSEPEFSIAKGLAYAGWIDENMRLFRQDIADSLTDERVREMAMEAMPVLLPAAADLLAKLVVQEAVLPIAQLWKRGGLDTLQQMKEAMDERIQRVLASDMAQEALEPAMKLWLQELAQKLQAVIDPVCDRYEVPRRQMQLDLSASINGSMKIDVSRFVGVPVVQTLLGVVISVIAGTLCGGGGVALLSAGPVGFAAGAAIGAALSLLGRGVVSDALMKADLPLLLRRIPIEKALAGDQTRRDLSKAVRTLLEGEGCGFSMQIADGFTRSFHSYLRTLTQAAEIPIE